MTDFTPTDLQDEKHFRILATLGHDDVTPFVGEYYLTRRNWLVLIHYLISLISLAAWVVTGFSQGSGMFRWLYVLGTALLVFILLVPVHEAIHGVVYRLLGARDIRFSVSLKEFYAYAIANQFVASSHEITWIALAPFILLNTALIVTSLTFPDYSFFLLGVLLIHISGTSGDWAIINFLWINRDKNVFTYDDADERKSYFFQKVD
jgi:hypothetical protein